MMRIHDRIAGSVIPLVVVVHAVRPAASTLAWRLAELRAVGDVSGLVRGGMLEIENSLPLDVSWEWIEQLALLIDDLETFDLVAAGNRRGVIARIQCVDSRYWEVEGSDVVKSLIERRFDAVELA